MSTPALLLFKVPWEWCMMTTFSPASMILLWLAARRIQRFKPRADVGENLIAATKRSLIRRVAHALPHDVGIKDLFEQRSRDCRLPVAISLAAFSTFAWDMLLRKPHGFETLLPGDDEPDLTDTAVEKIEGDYADRPADRLPSSRSTTSPAQQRE